MRVQGVLTAALLAASIRLWSGCGESTATRGKTVLVCLDGGTWESITPLLQAGQLPNTLEMMSEGAYGPLLADPPYSPPSWTSLATGLTPEHHGITNFVRRSETDRETHEYQLVPIGAVDVEVPRIWDMVATQGLEVNVQRWLFTYPIEEVAGVMVSDFQGKATDFLSSKPIEATLRERFQPSLFITADARLTRDRALSHDPPRSPERFRERDAKLARAVRDIDAAEQAFDYVLNHHPEIDFHTVSFFWGNQIQHEYLHYWLAPAAYGADAEEAERYREVIPDLYRIFDAFIGRLRSDPRVDNVMVVSDHGMQLIPLDIETNIGAYHFQILWDEILADLGFDEVVRPVAYARTETGLSIGAGVEKREQLRGELATALESLHFADSDTPLFEDVAPPPGAWPDLLVGRYAGVRYGDIPRLFDRPVRRGDGESFPAGRYLRFAGGFIRAEHGYDLNPDVALGEQGILLLSGPDVAGGLRLEAGVASTIDVTPTLLYLMGLPVGADMDGRVLQEVVRAEALDSRPVVSVPSYRSLVPERVFPAEAHSDDRYDEKTMERLRSLGYVN